MADQYLDDASIAQIKAANLPISFAAFEEIIADEDSSEFFYKQHYQRPEWPGAASGVTILLGYDLGYATHAKVDADLRGKIPDAMLAACQSCVGITGLRAHDAMLRVRNLIDLPWSVALDVFLHRDMPEWIATVRKVLPNTEKLSADCLGALVSLVYNRGASFDSNGDHYREMRAIKADMADSNFKDIPNQLRAMSRLWPTSNGVHSRRFREAALFEKGLTS